MEETEDASLLDNNAAFTGNSSIILIPDTPSPELKRRKQPNRREPSNQDVLKPDEVKALKRKAAFNMLRRRKQKKLCVASSSDDEEDDEEAKPSTSVSSLIADEERPLVTTQKTSYSAGKNSGVIGIELDNSSPVFSKSSRIANCSNRVRPQVKQKGTTHTKTKSVQIKDSLSVMGNSHRILDSDLSSDDLSEGEWERQLKSGLKQGGGVNDSQHTSSGRTESMFCHQTSGHSAETMCCTRDAVQISSSSGCSYKSNSNVNIEHCDNMYVRLSPCDPLKSEEHLLKRPDKKPSKVCKNLASSLSALNHQATTVNSHEKEKLASKNHSALRDLQTEAECNSRVYKEFSESKVVSSKTEKTQTVDCDHRESSVRTCDSRDKDRRKKAKKRTIPNKSSAKTAAVCTSVPSSLTGSPANIFLRETNSTSTIREQPAPSSSTQSVSPADGTQEVASARNREESDEAMARRMQEEMDLEYAQYLAQCDRVTGSAASEHNAAAGFAGQNASALSELGDLPGFSPASELLPSTRVSPVSRRAEPAHSVVDWSPVRMRGTRRPPTRSTVQHTRSSTRAGQSQRRGAYNPLVSPLEALSQLDQGYELLVRLGTMADADVDRTLMGRRRSSRRRRSNRNPADYARDTDGFSVMRGELHFPNVFDQGNEEMSYEALLELGDQLGEVRRNGMTDAEINRLPTSLFSDSLSAENAEDNKCHVCLCDYTNGDALRMLTCFHKYHTQCIDQWLKRNSTCPKCRQEVNLT